MAGKGMKPRVGYNYAKFAANYDHIKGFGKRKKKGEKALTRAKKPSE